MRKVLSWAMALAMVPLSWLQVGAQASTTSAKSKTSTKKKVASRKSSSKKAPSTAVRKKSPNVAKAQSTNKARSSAVRKSRPKTNGSQASPAKSKTRSKRAVRSSSTTWRNRQLSPTPERYKEIQAALAAKGYLQPDEATGQWSDRSVAALKKFQAEQNIEASGKLNSLSLIALGLGPKYDTRAALAPHSVGQSAAN